MRSVVAIFSIFTLILYSVCAIICGTILNDTFNGEERIGEEQNGVSFWLVLATIINSMIGIAAAVAGLLHFLEFNAASRFGTIVGAAVVMTLEFFVMGLAIKQWTVGGDALPDGLGSRETFLGAMALVGSVSEFGFLATVAFTPVPNPKDA